MPSIGLYSFVALYCATVLVVLCQGESFSSVLWLSGISIVSFLCCRVAHMPCRALVLPVIAGIAVALLRLAALPNGTPPGLESMFGSIVTLTGTVTAIPDVRETNEKLTVSISAGGSRTRILATVPLYPALHAGDVVRLSGKLQKPKTFDTEGGRTFAYGQFLRKDGVYAVISGQAERVGQSQSLWLRFLRMLESFKGMLVMALDTALPEPESALAVGILVGGKQGLGTRLINDFTKAGMLQIIVLSGFNVMIVASTLMRLLNRLPKRLAFALACTSIGSFVLMAGAGSSAVRAGLMAGFALAARTFGRPYEVLRIVCLSLLLIALWNPLTLAFDPGLQFSFLATLGLVLGTPLIAPRLLFLRNRTAIELLSTTLAAELALLPLLLYETGNLSSVSVFANAATMPAIPLAMGASTAAAALAWPLSHLSPVLPAVVGLPAFLPLAYVIRVATLSASLPFASRIIPSFPFWLVLLSYSGLALLTYRLSRPPRRETGSLRPPNSSSQKRRLRTTPSRTDGSRPYTRAPISQSQA